MDLAQKEATMLRVQEVHARANNSMAGGFLLSIDRMKASGMGWAQAWDGMWSGVDKYKSSIPGPSLFRSTSR